MLQGQVYVAVSVGFRPDEIIQNREFSHFVFHGLSVWCVGLRMCLRSAVDCVRTCALCACVYVYVRMFMRVGTNHHHFLLKASDLSFAHTIVFKFGQQLQC